MQTVRSLTLQVCRNIFLPVLQYRKRLTLQSFKLTLWKGRTMRNVSACFLTGFTPVMLIALPLFGQDKKPASPMSGMGGLLPMLLFMFLIIYFLMIRPEQKKTKERQKLLGNLKKGDKVMTAAGMYGIVGNVKETTVMVKIADNTVVEFSKNAISSVMSSDGSEKTPDKA